MVQRSSFVWLLWSYYLSFLHLPLTLYFVTTSDTTLSCSPFACHLTGCRIIMSCLSFACCGSLCHFSAFISATSLAWKRALCPNPRDFCTVTLHCKTWWNMWTCVSCCTYAVCNFSFDNSFLNCSLFLASISFCMCHTSAVKSSLRQELAFQLTYACDADL